MDDVDNVTKLLLKIQPLRRAGKFDEAKQLCDAWSTKKPKEQAGISLIRSYISRSENDFKQERDYLFDALQVDPKSKGTHDALLCYYTKIGSYHEALDIAEALIALDQEFQAFTESAYMHAAFCHFKLQNFVEAKECLTKCTDVDDVVPISGVKMKLGELRRALEDLD